MNNWIPNNKKQDMHDHKRHDDQDMVVCYLVYHAACDHVYPVFLDLLEHLLQGMKKGLNFILASKYDLSE